MAKHLELSCLESVADIHIVSNLPVVSCLWQHVYMRRLSTERQSRRRSRSSSRVRHVAGCTDHPTERSVAVCTDGSAPAAGTDAVARSVHAPHSTVHPPAAAHATRTRHATKL